jgi:hypothetical protein
MDTFIYMPERAGYAIVLQALAALSYRKTVVSYAIGEMLKGRVDASFARVSALRRRCGA